VKVQVTDRKGVKNKMLEPGIKSLVQDLNEESGSLSKLGVQVKRLGLTRLKQEINSVKPLTI
jgi:hypothetical protein